MARSANLQTNFSAGALAPELIARQDTEQYQNGAKTLDEFRCLIGGGVTRRPGSWREADLPGSSRAEPFIVNQTTKYVLNFGDGRMDAYAMNVTTGALTAAGSVSGALWTGSIWREMDVVQSANTMFLTHNSMRTQVLTRTGASTWTVGNFSFFTGPAARPEQPYLKLAAAAVTLQPSALTGSITLSLGGTSTSYFGASRVGEYIRYESRACLMTAVAGDGLSCTATVLETLPDTEDLTVASTAKFAVGEVVEGSVTSAKGVVTTITDSTHMTVVLNGENLIAFTTADTLTGPNATTTISAVAAASTKAAVTDWDEQLFGANGYPSCVELHRNRLLFGGHTAAPDYLIGSTLNNLYNFNVGTGADGDGIMESIGDAQASSIVQLHSGEQLIVLTDHGPYYVPESKTSPFVPSSLAFYSFGSPWPTTATAKARSFDGGVLFVSQSLIVKARPTGDLSRQWDADDDVGVLASHLIDNPTRMAVVSNFAGGPERYAVFINADGSLAVLQLVEVQKIRNITPWNTNGIYTSVCGIDKYLYCTTERSVAGNTRYYLERFDQNITLDLATEYTTEVLMDAGIPTIYGSTPVNVVAGQYHLGVWPFSLTTTPAGPYVVGLKFDPALETLPPVVTSQEGTRSGDYMRIYEALVDVQSSGRFAADGYALAAYQVTDDVDAAPNELDGAQRFQFLGWQRNPTISITQADPLPLTIRSIKSKVAH
jgi:hypothetical protein